jgi:hypothetical protein
VGAYEFSNGHVTSEAEVAVLGAFLTWIFLLGRIVSFLCALGLSTWQRWAFWLTIALEVINLLGGRVRVGVADVRPMAHCFKYGCRGGYPSVCVDSDRPSHAFPPIMRTWKAGQAHGQT